MSALLWALFDSQASLKFFKNAVIVTGLKKLEPWGFNCGVICFASLAVYFETDRLSFVKVFAYRWVQQSSALLHAKVPVWITLRFSFLQLVWNILLSDSALLERCRELKMIDLDSQSFRLLSVSEDDFHWHRFLRFSRKCFELSWYFLSCRLQCLRRERFTPDFFLIMLL